VFYRGKGKKRESFSLGQIVKDHGDGELRNSSTHSLTSALDVGGWSTPLPSCFTPEKKTRYLLYRRLGSPPPLEPICTVAGYLAPTGFRSSDCSACIESLC
jgi:hypothetical protein